MAKSSNDSRPSNSSQLQASATFVPRGVDLDQLRQLMKEGRQRPQPQSLQPQSQQPRPQSQPKPSAPKK